MRKDVIGDNWHLQLARAIKESNPGDVIVVRSESAAQLGHRAARRIHGIDHGIAFEVNGKTIDAEKDES